MDDWVKEYLALYYKSDEDCSGDAELQTFVKSLLVGLADAPKAVLERYREAGRSIEALHELLLSYMFTVSVHHAQRNFTMYDFMAFPPFMSLLLRSPVPRAKGQATERSFLDAMPSVFGTGAEVGLNGSLNRFSEDDWLLGRPLQDDWILDDDAVAARDRYYARLEEAGEEVLRRNRALETENAHHLTDPYLHPSRIPSCVAI